MSHFSRMTTNIRDGELLVECLRKAGYTVELNASIRGFEGSRSVDVAVRLPEGYDVGFVRAAGGNFEIVGDWWGVKATNRDELVNQVGEEMAAVQRRIQREAEELERKMRREYALKRTLEQLQSQGFQVTARESEEDGTVRLLARRWR